MNKKLIFNILLYLSLVFLVYYLYKFDYLQIDNLRFNYSYLIISVLFLWSGFTLSAISWWNVLRKHNIYISKSKAIASHGLAVFAKYIPGKIWVILGRASKAVGNKYSLKIASYASLKEQLLYVWLGLLLSAVPLIIFHGVDEFTIGVTVLFLGLTIFNFSDKVRKILIYLMKRFLKKELELPKITFKESLNILIYILVYWTFWIFAFYFFAKSIYPEAELSAGFIFPLGVTLGLLAIIVPGGIGVREGIMTGFMVLTGIPLEIATTISVISRLWFISGEVFIFFFSLYFNRKDL